MDKSTFGYIAPVGKVSNFAQCATCKMFLTKHGICSLHGKNQKITPSMSCNYYSPGGPAPESEMEHVSKAFTPTESGLVDRKVRCEHCEFFDEDDSHCLLFMMMNIDHKVIPDACCNAQTKEDDKSGDKKETLKKFTRNV